MVQLNGKWVALASCFTMLICSISVYGAGLASVSKTNSHKQALKNSLVTLDSRRLSVKDLEMAAASMTGYPILPNIYHSIIDDTHIQSEAASPVQSSALTTGDLHTAAGHHHGHAHGKYYEYREVPKKKTWKFGYKRGNHKHTISRHEHGKAGKHPHFKTKVKWHDKKSKGKGIHLWDYNHHDKKHHYG